LRGLPRLEEGRACGGGPQRGEEGAGLGSRPGGKGASRWPCWVEPLHFPPAFCLPGSTLQGQRVRVVVCHAMSCAPGSGGGGGLSGPRQMLRGAGVRPGPAAAGGGEYKRKAHVLHRGAGTRSVPPRRYTGRPSGKHHLLGQRAHRAVHHGWPGPDHSGATTSIRQPFRDAFVTTSSRRLNGGFAHRAPALG